MAGADLGFALSHRSEPGFQSRAPGRFDDHALFDAAYRHTIAIMQVQLARERSREANGETIPITRNFGFHVYT
jgi:hypothetical protein